MNGGLEAGTRRDGRGYFGSCQAVMPGQDHAVECGYNESERCDPRGGLDTLGKTTYDICLNDNAYWCNIPANAWGYWLGGYQWNRTRALRQSPPGKLLSESTVALRPSLAGSYNARATPAYA